MTSSKTYEIIVSSLAKRQLKKLPLQFRKVVGLCLDNLATCPRPQNCIKLKSRPCFVALLRSVAPCCFVSFVPAPSVLLFSATRWVDTSRFAWKMSSPPNHECSHALPFSFGVLVGKCSLRPCMLYTPLSIYGS